MSDGRPERRRPSVYAQRKLSERWGSPAGAAWERVAWSFRREAATVGVQSASATSAASKRSGRRACRTVGSVLDAPDGAVAMTANGAEGAGVPAAERP